MNLNRRFFIKTGSAAIAGSMILPPFMQSCQNAQISENVKSYLDHFEVSTREYDFAPVYAVVSKRTNFRKREKLFRSF